MAPDIRSFFGGKPTATQSLAATTAKKSRGIRKVVEDSDDEAPAKKQPAPKSVRNNKEHPPEEEATNKDDYFGRRKPKRSEPSRKSSALANGKIETPKPSPTKSTTIPSLKQSKSPANRQPNGMSNSRLGSVRYDDSDFNMKDAKLLDDEMSGGDDIYAEDYKTNGRGDDEYEVAVREASEKDNMPNSWTTKASLSSSKVNKYEDNYEIASVVEMRDLYIDQAKDDDDDDMEIDRTKQKSSKAHGRKRKSNVISDDEDDGSVSTNRKAAKKSITTRKSPAKKAKKEHVQDSTEIQAILDNIPLVRPPSPSAANGEKKKFPFGGHANSGPAPAEGSKELPKGAENCLAGLQFVFTGLLNSISREGGQELVKRYGGKCNTAPSSKTSYVVLGTDAGPKKLETIQKLGLKTINEDGLFALIERLPANGGDSKASIAFAERQKKEMDKIRAQATELEKTEQAAAKTASAKAAAKASLQTACAQSPPIAEASSSSNSAESRLWTVKYAPTDLKQICGNKTKVEVLQRWLRTFHLSQKRNFKMAGPDGTGLYRAVIISGPPGIGKTTAAHLVAKIEGYDVVESNASDTRSKKLVDTSLKGVLDTTSLLGYFAGDGERAEKSKKKLVLIMDEVDGMSAGDRGGAGALASLCKTSSIPIILICNERKLPKMKPFDHVTYNMPFIRPTTDMIRSRVMTIAFREGMKLPLQIVNALIEGTGADIRQVVNMLAAVKLDAHVNGQDMNFDDSKEMSKAWEKFTVLKPWDTIHKILSSGMFSSASKATLNDKISLYFNDHGLNPLMMQENYLNTSPMLSQNYSGREQRLKNLELIEKASNSISEGDLVDRMIHGSQQHWSLMPTHAVMSFVRPANFVAGTTGGYQSGFPAWMGKNSTQTKLTRLVKEIQGHMRLRCSADRHAIRQYYIPLLWARLVRKLEVEGKESVPQVIELMDSYYLTKDDWESILELGIGPMDQTKVKLETQTKSTFTRMYNAQSHPLPFMKAGTLGAPRKQAQQKPDFEDAIEESDEGELVDDVKGDENEEDLDLSKDKYVKAPKKKKAPAKGKGRKATDEVDASEDDAGPKKAKSKGKGKSKK